MVDAIHCIAAPISHIVTPTGKDWKSTVIKLYVKA
jgi:hypothetical protein